MEKIVGINRVATDMHPLRVHRPSASLFAAAALLASRKFSKSGFSSFDLSLHGSELPAAADCRVSARVPPATRSTRGSDSEM